MLFSKLAIVALCISFSPLANAAVDSSYPFNVEAKPSSWLEQLRTKISPNEATLEISVKDANGNAVDQASVLVGSAIGAPFAGNQVLTDAGGVVRFSNAALGNAIPAVTVSKAGFSSFTMVAPPSLNLTIRLPKIPAPEDTSFIRGKADGFPPGYPSTTLELGVFLPAFRPESLLNFDPTQFVSSYTVPINVFGERQVPGNLLLPTQRKRYGFIPISLSKNDYAMPLSKNLVARMAALAGAVPISDAVGAIQKNDFLGALNLANFTHVAYTEQPVNMQGDQSIDLTLNREIQPKALTATLTKLPALDIVGVSMVDPSGQSDDFVPLDIKGIKAEDVTDGKAVLSLGSLKEKNSVEGSFVFTGLFDRKQLADLESGTHSIVGALQPLPANASTVDFSAYFRSITKVAVSDDHRHYQFTSPTNAEAGLVPDLVLVNIVAESKNEETKGKNRRLLWSAVLPGNAESLNLPDLGSPVLPAPGISGEETFHWEVIAVKASSTSGSDIQSVLRNLRHVSSLIQNF